MNQNLNDMSKEEWLEWRRKGIGSSDAPVIMQVSPWGTPHELWQEKVYGNAEKAETPAMTRGKEKEAEGRAWFEQAMNVTLFPQNVVHESIDWLRSSFDGLDLERNTALEIKWPNKEDHQCAVNKRVPDKYWPQVQHQIKVQELPGMYYLSCHGNDKRIVEVPRDNSYITSLLVEEKNFWDKVISKEAPELTERDLIPMEGNKEWEKWCKKWIKVKDLLDRAEEKEKEIRNTLISLSNDRSAYGNGVKISRSLCPGQTDYKQAIHDYIEQLKSAHPDIAFPELLYDIYRKKHFTKWTFSPIRKKS